MLDQLPSDTLGKVIANLLHVDLKSLSLVSYRLRAITLPFLFRSPIFICPDGHDGQEALLRLKGLAARKPILPLVHRLTISGKPLSSTFLRPPPLDRRRPLMAYTVTPYIISLPFPNLRRLSLNDLPLDNAFLLALIDLATRKEIELYLTRCRISIDPRPITAFELRIVTFAAMRGVVSDSIGSHRDIVYNIISASSRHLRTLGLCSDLLDPIDRLLQIKFDSLRILQLHGAPIHTGRIFSSTLSKVLRHLGSLDKLILWQGLMVDPEILFEGAPDPPHYNSLDASYQVCRMLVPNNTVTSLHCRCSILEELEITKGEERKLIAIIEEGLPRNRKPSMDSGSPYVGKKIESWRPLPACAVVLWNHSAFIFQLV